MVSNSRKKIHQTWERPYRDSLYPSLKLQVFQFLSLLQHWLFECPHAAKTGRIPCGCEQRTRVDKSKGKKS